MWTQDNDFPFLFLNFDSLLEFNSGKRLPINIWRIQWDGISIIKFEAGLIHFLSDVLVADAVVVA